MSESPRDFFQHTTLFMMKLLRHLVIQVLIVLFVLVEIRLHKFFIEQTILITKPAHVVAPAAHAHLKPKKHKKPKKRAKARRPAA